uniref:Uncharacterized protein n=1 Tax=Romanomermis culicivorax TaxID=13658 RepID=A0A915J9Q5_ROMCU
MRVLLNFELNYQLSESDTCLFIEIGIIFWIKFVGPTTSTAALITTGLLIPVFIVFIWFTYTFYKKLTLHKYEVSKNRLDDLEDYCTRLNEFESVNVTLAVPPVRSAGSGRFLTTNGSSTAPPSPIILGSDKMSNL